MGTKLAFGGCLALAWGLAFPGTPSALWGKQGDRWSPSGRLPDFSFAGYRRGEKALPLYPVRANVRDFGAKGDGNADDTRAFNAAIAATGAGAIYVPPGRYRITDYVTIGKPGVVLRGAGPDSSVLVFPKPLNDIHPAASHTSTGDLTTAYSFDHGFLTLQGDLGARDLSAIAAAARRGDQAVTVASAAGLAAGQEVRVSLSEDAAQSLKTALYAGDPGDISNGKDLDAKFVAKVAKIEGRLVTLDRPLPFEIRLAWKPVLQSFKPSVRESGFESLALEFPDTPYPGHFKELGYNGIELRAVADCWVRDVRLRNADMGVLFVDDACFNTAQGVTLTAYAGRGVPAGHHAWQFKRAQDNLAERFDVRAPFVHDLSVEHASGNVYATGRGADLCIDGHEDTPFGNLFVDLDAGAGKRLWQSGGGAGLGRHVAAWNTFWNIRADADLPMPPADWAPPLINLVALRTAQPSATDPAGRWIESVPPAAIDPPDIRAAQVAKRLGLIPVLPRARRAPAKVRAWGLDGGTVRFGERDLAGRLPGAMVPVPTGSVSPR